jgi:hypothetical protein
MIKNILVALTLLAGATSAQDNLVYRCPKGGATLPASCLEDMKVRDVNRSLNSRQRHQLAYLFIKSYVVSIVKYKQDYPVDPNAPVCKLLIANFPEVGQVKREGGVWPGDVFRSFTSKAEYQADVKRALNKLTIRQRRQFGF